MKLWLLKPINPDAAPWDPWYDKAFGFVVRAETEADAREIATANGGDECSKWADIHKEANVSAWRDPVLSSCVELTADGPAEMVLQDFHSA